VEAELSTKGRVSLVITWTARGDAPPPPDPALMRTGTIQVKLQGAAGLKAADLNGKSDPYAVLSLCGKQHKSTTVSKSLDPRWNETFTFEGTLGDLTSESLQLEIFDKDRITRDDSLGSASVSLFDLRSVREKVVEAELSTKGRVSLVITWTARGDAPPPPDPALMRTGTIQVKLQGAAGLKAADLNGKSDPYAVLSLCGKQHKSTTVSKSLDPRWNETFTFEGTLGDLTSESLQIAIFDKDRIGRDDFLGSAVVNLLELRAVHEKLVEAELSIKGTVSLQLTWMPNSPTSAPAETKSGAASQPSVELAPASKISAQEIFAVGVVEVELQAGFNLKPADRNGFSDPYVIFSLGNKTKKSSTIRKSLNPQWHEKFEFEGVLRDLTSDKLLLQVFDKDTIGRDELLGQAEVDLLELRASSKKSFEVNLSTQGSISLSIALTPHEHGPTTSPGAMPVFKQNPNFSLPGEIPHTPAATSPPAGMLASISESFLAAKGSMRIELQRAVGLKAADSNGLSDPYAVLYFLGKKHTSKVVPKTLNPQWDQSFEFVGTLRELTSEACLLEVFDKDRFTRDESLGKKTIDLACMRSRHEQELEIALPTQGTVFVRVAWTPK